MEFMERRPSTQEGTHENPVTWRRFNTLQYHLTCLRKNDPNFSHSIQGLTSFLKFYFWIHSHKQSLLLYQITCISPKQFIFLSIFVHEVQSVYKSFHYCLTDLCLSSQTLFQESLFWAVFVYPHISLERGFMLYIFLRICIHVLFIPYNVTV